MRVIKVIYKDVRNLKTARQRIKELDKKGYKNTMIVDSKLIGSGRNIRGIGTRVMAFKGRKPIPKGFRTKKEEF